MFRKGFILFMVVLSLFVVSGCSGLSLPKSEPATAGQNGGNEKTDGKDSGTGNGGEKEPASNGTKEKEPITISVDQQQNHVTGVTVYIENVTVEEKLIKVKFEADSNKPIRRLKDSVDSSTLSLTDDKGGVYLYIPSKENEGLEIPENGKLSGTLLFAGRLVEGAQKLILEFNANERDKAEVNKKDTMTLIPYFKYEINLTKAEGKG